MAECEPRKIGRPKTDQTLPLILAQARQKVVREFTMEAPLAQLIEDYSAWAAEVGSVSRGEARELLVGHAIDAFVRKDRLFSQFIRDQKRKETK